MQLFYLPGSPYARIARVLARELRLDCREVEDSGFPPLQAAGLNPALQVPTLVDGERRLFGTRLIADYLLEAGAGQADRGAPPLVRQAVRGEERWRDAQLLTGLDSLLASLVARSYLIWTGAKHQPGAAISLDLAEREMTRSLSLLDWLEGEAHAEGFLPGLFSLQDLWLIATLDWTEARIAIPWRGRPRLEAIHARHAARESLCATLPPPWKPES